LGLRLESLYYHISEKELQGLAQSVAARVKTGDVVFLSGDLGSGKTTFMKAVAGAYGLDQRTVRSPTFTLINRYETKEAGGKSRNVLFHLDCYRIDSVALENIGFFDLSTEEAIVFIEWPENVLPLFRKVDWLFTFFIPEDTMSVRDVRVYRHHLIH